MNKKKPVGVVYSTNTNFSYQFEKNEEEATLSPREQDLRIMRDSKGRGGKTVTLIKGFIGKSDDLEQLSKKLKTYCGVGGACKEGEILLQGDVRDKACSFLEKESYRFKRAGG